MNDYLKNREICTDPFYMNAHVRSRTKTTKSVLADRTNADALFHSKNQFSNLHSHRRSLVGSSSLVKGKGDQKILIPGFLQILV